MESIKSIQDNPFYKSFGVKHSIPSTYRSCQNLTALEQTNRSSTSGLSSFLDDGEIGEYRPVSGYVHKLLDKFASLSAKEEQISTASHLKRSSSLEEQLAENEVVRKKSTTDIGQSSKYDKPTYLAQSNLSHRARSVENLNHIHNSQGYHNHLIPYKQDETQWDTRSAVKGHKHSKNDLNGESKSISKPVKGFTNEDSVRDDKTSQIIDTHEIVHIDELPKPNTVLTVRSIFEGANSGNRLYTRRHKSDSSPLSPPLKPFLLSLVTEHSTSSQDGLSNQVRAHSTSPVTSPRHGDGYAKPVLVPAGANLSRSPDFKTYGSEVDPFFRSDKSPTQTVYRSSGSTSYKSSTSSLKENSSMPSSSSSICDSQSVYSNDESSLTIAGSDSVATTSSDSQHTANIKPTIIINASNNQLPLSPSVLATTGHIKPRPVVSVAPFRDKPEDCNDDIKPKVIYSKSKPSFNNDKPRKNKEYTEPNDFLDGTENDVLETEQNILEKESEKFIEGNSGDISEMQQNKNVSAEKNFTNTNSQTVDEDLRDQNKIIYSKQHTTIEIKDTPRNRWSGQESVSEGESKIVENEADSKRSVKLISASTARSTHPRRKAPEPPTQLNKPSQIQQNGPKMNLSHSMGHSNNSQPATPDNKTMKPAIQDDKTANKRSHAEDTALFDELPIKKISENNETTKDEPVKGIPSIIAQRLRQQNSSPSQAAFDMISSSNVFDPALRYLTEMDSAYPRTLLTPLAINSSNALSGNNVKENISSEIENEIAAVRRKMEENRSKSGGPTPIFGSDQLTKKKKDNHSISSQRVVPLLDLSSITNDGFMEYHPPPMKIEPCKIIFIGENAKTSRSLLVKQRKIKVTVHFSEGKAEIFEYLGEDVALETYLESHPEEKVEVLILQDLNGINGESSDDTDVLETLGISKDDLLKSNTGLAHTGNLQSYTGRFHQEYNFGDILTVEPKVAVPELEAELDPEKLMLRPAEINDSNTWSTTDSSDLLF